MCWDGREGGAAAEQQVRVHGLAKAHVMGEDSGHGPDWGRIGRQKPLLVSTSRRGWDRSHPITRKSGSESVPPVPFCAALACS